MLECGEDGGEAGETQKAADANEASGVDSNAGLAEQHSPACDLSRSQMEQVEEALACYAPLFGRRVRQGSGNSGPRAPSSAYIGHFERQLEARCGMHALNNAIGQPTITTAMMRAACDEYLKRYPTEDRSENEKPSGWYSMNVMVLAIDLASELKAGMRPYELRLRPWSERTQIVSDRDISCY